MSKVRFKYAVPDYYRYWIYKQKTVDMTLPTNEYGFILITSLGKKIEEYICSTLGITKFRLIWYKIIEEYKED